MQCLGLCPGDRQGADINPPAINSGVPLEQEKSLPGSRFAIGAGCLRFTQAASKDRSWRVY